jgi:hypothetical protein
MVEKLPPTIRAEARIHENGEVSWPAAIAGDAISALAAIGCVVLGTDVRLYEPDGDFVEIAWSALSNERIADPDPIQDGLNQALDALARWHRSEYADTEADVWVLVTWQPPGNLMSNTPTTQQG